MLFPDSEDGKEEEEGDKDAGTGEEEEEEEDEDDDQKEEGDVDSKSDETELPVPPVKEVNEPEETKTMETIKKSPSAERSSPLPQPPSPPAIKEVHTDRVKSPRPPPMVPLLPDDLELAERPLSSLENMSKAIEQKLPSVFDKYPSPKLKETVKLPYKPSIKVIKEMSRLGSSSNHAKVKDKSSSSPKGQSVPPSVSRHINPANRTYPCELYTPDNEQPLDLSKKPKSSSSSVSYSSKVHDSKHSSSSSKSQYQYTPLPPSTSSPSPVPSSGSSLSNLEKRFGGNSFLFDGTSGKLNAPKNPLYQAFGGNLFATALYNTPPLASTDQVYRPHYRNYWPGPIPAPRHSTKPLPPASSSSSSTGSATTKSHTSGGHHHDSDKSSARDHVAHKEEPSCGGAGNNNNNNGLGSNGKYTNLTCSCKKQFETLYELTIHMQNTGHTPLPNKNGDQGEYPKLVRGQDMWLNQGMEQTRQILRCMQCGESFKSLPELTIHMMKTRHYTNIVGAESRKIHKYTSYYSDNEEEDRGSVFCCKVCHESFKDMDGLANHMVVSGHHKKHMLKSSSGGQTVGSSSGSSGGGIVHELNNCQSPKPAGIPVAPSHPAHSIRKSKSPTATVATLLDTKRTLVNGTSSSGDAGGSKEIAERKRKDSNSSRYDDWKSKHIKTEKTDDTASHGENGEAELDLSDVKKDEQKESVGNVTIKEEADDSDDDCSDSFRKDLPEVNKIRCENCGERIETPKFVEHVRACVNLSTEQAPSPKEPENTEEKALNLKRHTRPFSPPSEKSESQLPIEYIPYKKRGRYEEALAKARSSENEKAASEDEKPTKESRSHLAHDRYKSKMERWLNYSRHMEERQSSPSSEPLKLTNPERPKSQDMYRPQELERPLSHGSDRSVSSEPLRPWSAEQLSRSRIEEQPPRPRSSEEHSRSWSIDHCLRVKAHSSLGLRHWSNEHSITARDIDTGSRNGAATDSENRERRLSTDDSLTRPDSKESVSRSESAEVQRTTSSPVLHSTTGSATLPELGGEGSALKAMENFIERSFTSNSNKPSFYRSNPLNGRMGSLSMTSISRSECPLPDSTAQHIDSYAMQHKYLPPSLPTNLKVEKPEPHNKETTTGSSPKVKEEKETGENAGDKNKCKTDGGEADTSDSESRNTSPSSPKPLHHKYLSDDGKPEEKSSALQSLQGLVYGKSFSTEHPLDSLQKLIHNTDTPSSVMRPNGTQQTYVTGMAALQQQGLPSTVILVNPIVTVMPTSSATSAVHINISQDSSPPTTGGQCSPTSSTPTKNSPVADAASGCDGDQAGDFRCQACNRTFASKGSYRYHLSRCHLSSVKRYGIKEAFNMSPYVYLPLDHTAKFNKYYEMANELANKGK